MKTLPIESFSKDLMTRMKEQLHMVELETQDTVDRVQQSLAVVQTFLPELRDFIIHYKFKDNAEEITFFKEIKPRLMSEYYYLEKLMNIKCNEPCATTEAIKEYYVAQIDVLAAQRNKHREFYHYCLSKATHFDPQYFTRSNTIFPNLDIDKRFTTGFDNLLAKMLAEKLVKEYLQNLLTNLTNESSSLCVASLTWTGSKTSLIELIYALQSSEVFNQGKADIKQVATAFEKLFQVNLGNYYRVFQEIRLRKSGQTLFIEELKKKLTLRMEELD